MIEGVKIRIGGDELKAELERRADHHRSKAAWYRDRTKELGDEDDELAGQMSNSPRDSMQASAQSHERKASYFAFMAAHIVTGETYELAESDISRLEIARAYL